MDIDSLKSNLRSLVKSKHFLPFLVIALAFPVTLALALTQQTFLNHAGGSSFASVEVNPGSLNVEVGDKVPMSALGYDTFHNPMFGGVAYSWSMSSDNSVGTLSKTDGDISEFTALQPGCGEITVTGINNGNPITKSVSVAVSGQDRIPDCSPIPTVTPTPNPTSEPTVTPTPAVNPISWKTGVASLSADNFSMEIGGKVYYSNDANLSLHSDPGINSNPQYDTLEATWNENGVEMRLFLYFSHQNGDFWKLYDVRTYDGQNPGDWIFYDPVDSFGQPIENEIGSPYINSTLDFYPRADSQTVNGAIHFENIHLQPFLDQQAVTPTPTPSPTPELKTKLFVATADTYVRSDAPKSNFGNQTSLVAKGTPRYITYLKFNLSSIKGKKIQKMFLSLKTTNSVSAPSVATENIKQVISTSWQENSLTYNSRPTLWGTLATFKGNKRNTIYNVDITNPTVISNLNTSSLVTFGIDNSSGDGIIINSKEASVDKPMLIIKYY